MNFIHSEDLTSVFNQCSAQPSDKTNCKKLPQIRARVKENSRLLPTKAIDIMTEWYDRHYSNPYPTYRDCEMLAQMGGITVSQVKQWFVNVRRRTQNQFRKIRDTRNTKRRISNETEELPQDFSCKKSRQDDIIIFHDSQNKNSFNDVSFQTNNQLVSPVQSVTSNISSDHKQNESYYTNSSISSTEISYPSQTNSPINFNNYTYDYSALQSPINTQTNVQNQPVINYQTSQFLSSSPITNYQMYSNYYNQYQSYFNSAYPSNLYNNTQSFYDQVSSTNENYSSYNNNTSLNYPVYSNQYYSQNF
ncbi:unnamed protein product [Brachionus calyciflorus]|uniref:Homeobox domain-containing protein n=1 Tax=Brachionus calyciflorus TaxID=104777 RepID=A0A813XF23_9BILA|nr:unnamed protein product [Brachionus calyciflorus]